MWRMGIINSYTMESTFGGSTLGSKRDTHFTIEDLKSLGYHVCDTILDFCDPDQTKYTQCLQELKELLQQEIHKKLNNFGQDMDLEGNWSDIPLSDIESSTSGSDSSLSDGPPIRLLSIADELHQKMVLKNPKKKRLQTRKQRNEQYQKNYLMRELKLTENAPTQLSGREKGTSLDAPLTSPKTKEITQSKKPGFTASCSPKRSTNSSLGPAPDVKPNWPKTRYSASRKDHAAMAGYPSLHIYTYP